MKRKIFSKLLMGAFLIASVSMFVSCKDYDDDINKNAQDIAALKAQLGTDINDVKSNLTTQLATVNSQIDQLKKDIDAKASASDLTSVKKDVDELKGLLERVSVLETKIKELASLEDLAKKANQADLDKLVGDLAAVSGKIPSDDAIKSIAEGVVKSLDIQGEALKVFQDNIGKSLEGYLTQADLNNLNTNVQKLQELLSDEYVGKLNDLVAKDLLTKDEIDSAIKTALEEKFQSLNDSIAKLVGPQMSALELFVNKKLTSIVLKPNFYWEGIEGIEAPFIYQTPVFEEKGEYTFKYNLTSDPAGVKTVDVKVAKSMGWKGFADKRELGKYVFAGPNAAHYDYPVANAIAATDTKITYPLNNKTNSDVNKLNIAYGAVAKYNLNPNIADIEKATIGFIENDAPVYTRAQGLSIEPKVVADDVVNNGGLLTVPFTVNYVNVIKYFVDWTNTQTNNWEGKAGAAKEDWSKLWYPLSAAPWATYGSDDADAAVDQTVYGGFDAAGKDVTLPFVALNIDVPVNEEKGVKEAYSVNSDWAVVVPALYEIVALADKAPDEALDLGTFTKPAGSHEIRKNHLYETVGYDDGPQAWDANKTTKRWNDDKGYGAIPMPATHGVLYNKSIDLRDYVETHYNYLTFAQYGKSQYDGILDNVDGGKLMEKLGLEYRFTIIDYWVGNEKTSESAHIEQSDGKSVGSLFTPRSVDEKGNTIKGETATREAVDREPLVRVDLVSTKDNNAIIRYGYIKLRIVEEEATLYDQEVSIDIDDLLYMNCGDEKSITWSQVENLILAKLGSIDPTTGKASGMTKNEFEKNYKLDVYGNYDYMPFIKPTNFDPANTDNPGPLYTKTWQAKRYFRKSGEAPKLMAITEASNYTAAQDETTLNKWTLTDNHFGEVWYTPHDNATEGHNWDEQTNVLIWNFYPGDYTVDRTVYSATVLGKEQAGTMNGAKYQKLIDLTKATYSNQGTSQEAISTTVRFINKKTDRSLWVTLRIPKEHIFFAYADINKRVLDHWYDFKTGYKDNTPDTIEVYANVPTPAEINRATGVTVSGFTKNLTEYWLNQNINASVVFHGNVAKFDKFTGGKSPVAFRFRLPKKGENADFDPAADGTWTVPGASGTTWTVKLNKQDAPLEDQIIAVKKNGVAYGPTVICTLTKAGTIHWMGRTEGAALFDNKALAPNKEDVNEPANDILNYIGMYDAKGNLQKKTYLSGQQNKTFAAYVEIQVTNDCYTPLIGKNYFNVRFLRPINVWPAQTEWTDAPNETQIYDIWRLINIRDWRTYAVVLDNQKQQLDDSNIIYEGKFVDGEKASVPYSFYNITNVYVERDAIKSDAYLEPAKRVIGDPSNLLSIDEIPALTGKNDGIVNWQYLKIMPVGTSKETAGKTAIGLPESTQSGDILAYTNNGGVVKPFHVYVPIKVVYSHGALKPWTQTVWAVIKINPTVGNE